MTTNAHCSKRQPAERARNPRDSHPGCPGEVWEYHKQYGGNDRTLVACDCSCHQETTT